MSQIPPSLQDLLNRLNQANAQLQGVLVRKQQFEAELKEVERAMTEIDKLPQDATVYKSVGNFLVPQSKSAALQELRDRKELLELHVKTLSRQESLLREQLEKIRDEINKELARLKGAAEASKSGG
jgi:prefoldin beta subunit